jgi:signal peptidase I
MNKLLKVIFWTVGSLVVVAVLLRLTLFETWTIPHDPWLSASIRPTLAGGDTVVLLTRGTPSFGDLVRCTDPEDETGFVVGRIMAEEGDHLEVMGRTVRVNRLSYNSVEACKEREVVFDHPETGHATTLDCSRVELGGGWHFRASGKHDKRNDVTKEVGAGRVFLLSDNRDVHDDSRDFGALPLESCNRLILFRLWGPLGWRDGERRFTVIR